MAGYLIKTVRTATIVGNSGETLIEVERELAGGGDKIILTMDENMFSVDEAKNLYLALGIMLYD